MLNLPNQFGIIKTTHINVYHIISFSSNAVILPLIRVSSSSSFIFLLLSLCFGCQHLVRVLPPPSGLECGAVPQLANFIYVAHSLQLLHEQDAKKKKKTSLPALFSGFYLLPYVPLKSALAKKISTS